jgi:hypothetical protein
MMKKLAICLVLLIGCQKSDDKKSVEQIQEQVMVIHDEVMPRSMELMDLKEKISHQIDSPIQDHPRIEQCPNPSAGRNFHQQNPDRSRNPDG